MEKIDALAKERLAGLTRNGRTVLEFSADRCLDCRFLDPVMPETEKDFIGSKFFQINRDNSVEMVRNLLILGIPGSVVYQDGQEIGGLVNKDRKIKDQVGSFLRSPDQ